jgi:hypothetical protein
MQWIQRSIVALVVAGPLSLGLVSPTTAQLQIQDGLVNVAIGDIEVLNNANIGIAAEVVAQVCGLTVGNIAVLAEQVDANRRGNLTICQSNQGPVVISQN